MRARAKLKVRRRKHGHKPPYYNYADKPVEFAFEVLEIEYLTDEQKEVLESLPDNRETNVQAGHGVGKTFLAAIAVIWWVFAVGGTAITTAPTENQVKELLWSEIRKLYDRHSTKLGGECLVMSLRLTEDARAYGFTARDYSEDSFQGKHGEKLLAIQDEANGITQEIDDGFESCITGAQNRGLRIGNPVTPGTPFDTSCQRSSIRIPVWSHPNVSWAYELHEDAVHRLKPEVADAILERNDNGKMEVKPQDQWPEEFPRDKIPGAVSISWIETIRSKKGEQSSYWTSRVNGYFPKDNQYSIVPASWFMKARARYDANPDYWDKQAESHDWRHGLDVGDGDDPHAMVSWKGPVLYAADIKETKGDMKDVHRASEWGKDTLDKKPGRMKVDNVGVGSGALSNLLKEDYDAVGFKFSEGAKDPAKFTNIKGESFWALREAFQEEEIAIAPLGEHEEQLKHELSMLFYEEMNTGKIKMEPKKKTRKRIGQSPNLADSTVYGFIKKKKKKTKKRNFSQSYTTY